MVKCPFCSFANEDGALFCEQCKSDISNVAPTAATDPGPAPTPMPESIPPAELLPMEAPVMAAIVEDDIVVAEVIPITPAAEPIVVAEVMAEAVVLEPVAPVVAEASPPPPMEVGVAAPPAASIGEPIADAAPPPAAPMLEPAVAAPPPAVEVAPPPAAAAPATPPVAAAVAAGASPKLVVQRGLKIGEEYPLFAGENYIGRADEKPVDVDLTFQEPEDRVWCSRQHALIMFDENTGALTIEDLNSSNGTFVNRERVYPGQPRQLAAGNTIQIGTVHLKVKV